MATFTKLPSGTWRVQIRRKGRYVSETFQRREDARRWALGVDVKADRGEAPISSRIVKIKTFGEVVDLHIEDMTAVGNTPLRSKAAALDLLKRELGKCKISALDRERLIKFGRDRADQGAGPVTLGIDIGMIKLVLSHAAAIHGLEVTGEPVDLA
jgi:isopenicillin N synthase-like dioxygenase